MLNLWLFYFCWWQRNLMKFELIYEASILGQWSKLCGYDQFNSCSDSLLGLYFHYQFHSHWTNVAGERVEYYMFMGIQKTQTRVSGLIMYQNQYMTLLDLKVASFSFIFFNYWTSALSHCNSEDVISGITID